MPILTDRLSLLRVARWRRLISKTWQHQVHDVIATGHLLIRAHDDLINIHGAWAAMVANDLPFSHATAQKLMRIARHPVLRDYSHGNRLPMAWTTLYQLSLIDAPTLEQLLTSGEVNPRTERHDIERMRRIAPPGSDLAIVIDSRQIAAAIGILRAAVSKFIDRIYERIAAEMMTEEELNTVLTELDAVIEQMRQFGLDVERRVRVEPMRTVNPPMWEDE
jgi:hypothetical protein